MADDSFRGAAQEDMGQAGVAVGGDHDQIDLDARDVVSKAITIEGVQSERFELLTIPQPDEGATLALVLDRGIQPRDHTAAALCVLAGVSAAGLVLAWFFLKQGI